MRWSTHVGGRTVVTVGLRQHVPLGLDRSLRSQRHYCKVGLELNHTQPSSLVWFPMCSIRNGWWFSSTIKEPVYCACLNLGLGVMIWGEGKQGCWKIIFSSRFQNESSQIWNKRQPFKRRFALSKQTKTLIFSFQNTPWHYKSWGKVQAQCRRWSVGLSK